MAGPTSLALLGLLAVGYGAILQDHTPWVTALICWGLACAWVETLLYPEDHWQ